MISVLVSSAVSRGFEHQSYQTKDHEMCICGFFSKNETLRNKSKDWLALNQNNVSNWKATCLSADCWCSELAR